MKTIPVKLMAYNLYNEGNMLLGVDAEITLPTFTSQSNELAGSGIMGTIDDPSPGLFGSLELEIKFHAISEDVMLLNEPKAHLITLRADQAAREASNQQELVHSGLVVIAKGIPKEFAAGKAKAGESMDTSIKLELTYVKLEREGKTILEVDKFNYIYVVNGVDYMEQVRAHI